jgi:hypothetical protein
VVDDGDTGPPGDRLFDVLEDRLGMRPRKRNFGDHHRRARLLSQMHDRVAHGVVDVANVQHFITRLKAQRAQHRVAARRRVGDERDVLGLRPEETGQPPRCLTQCAGYSRKKNRVGCASIRLRQRFCSASTTRGVAP